MTFAVIFRLKPRAHRTARHRLAAVARFAAASKIGAVGALLWLTGTVWLVGLSQFATAYWRIFARPSLAAVGSLVGGKQNALIATINCVA